LVIGIRGNPECSIAAWYRQVIYKVEPGEGKRVAVCERVFWQTTNLSRA
jgi:hypothetical protein